MASAAAGRQPPLDHRAAHVRRLVAHHVGERTMRGARRASVFVHARRGRIDVAHEPLKYQLLDGVLHVVVRMRVGAGRDVDLVDGLAGPAEQLGGATLVAVQGARFGGVRGNVGELRVPALQDVQIS